MKRLIPGERQRVSRAGLGLVAGLLACGLMTPAWAEDCRGLTERMLEQHPRLLAAKRDVEAARANVGKVRGGWFPDLKVNGATGQEQRKPANGGKRTDMEAQTLTMTLNQLLWDFGKTNAELSKAELALMQSELTLGNQRADLIHDAATTCVNLLKNYRALAFAQQSVENIRKQTGLEESRVELGGGLETDALQSRSQLSGAQARLARAKGAVNTAINHFRNLFEVDPGPPESLFELANPAGRLPASLDQVLAEVRDGNLQIQLAQVAVTTSQMEKRRVIGAELSPRMGAVVEKKYKEDAEGVQGNQQEFAARVEMSYPFNLGLAGFHALEGAREGMAAAENRLEDARRQTDEQARNGWETIRTTQENAEFLENQARIAAEFLRMARQERLHGARSLIDVLSGETGLINAQSDAETAWADVLVARFGLLKIMGALDLELLQRGKRFELPKADALEGEKVAEPASKSAQKPASTKQDKPVPAKQEKPVPAKQEKGASAPKPPVTGRSAGGEMPVTPEQAKKPDNRSESPLAPVTPTAERSPSVQDGQVVTVKHARLRAKPEIGGAVLRVVAPGGVLTVVDRSPDGQWLRLDSGAWVASVLVKPFEG
ncbi:MAG: TolC family protein [Magnetococcales bacterium]|nr:TolC family protein [Magnetococcales bacterium]